MAVWVGLGLLKPAMSPRQGVCGCRALPRQECLLTGLGSRWGFGLRFSMFGFGASSLSEVCLGNNNNKNPNPKACDQAGKGSRCFRVGMSHLQTEMNPLTAQSGVSLPPRPPFLCSDAQRTACTFGEHPHGCFLGTPSAGFFFPFPCTGEFAGFRIAAGTGRVSARRAPPPGPMCRHMLPSRVSTQTCLFLEEKAGGKQVLSIMCQSS